MNRAEYARRWSSANEHPSFVRVDSVDVPENVERRADHLPCSYCGVRPDVACRHRSIAA